MGLGFLDGLRKWAHRNIHVISGVCSLLGMPEVGALLELIDLSTNIGDKITTGDLDKASADILDQWDDKKYTPFYVSLLHSLSSNVLNTKLSNEVRAQFANDILLKIEAVKSYYLTYENSELSPEGVATRIDYIIKTTDIIVQRIYGDDLHPGIGTEFNVVPIEQKFKDIDLSLLEIPSTINDFIVTVNLFELSKDINVLTPSTTTVAANPKITPAEISDIINVANNGIAISPKGVPGVVTPPIDKTKIAKVIALLLIGVGLMLPSKSKSKSK
jgi:hypothetical protein